MVALQLVQLRGQLRDLGVSALALLGRRVPSRLRGAGAGLGDEPEMCVARQWNEYPF